MSRRETLKERESIKKKPGSDLYVQALCVAYLVGPNPELVETLECGLARGVESMLLPQLALERASLRKMSIHAVLQLQKELGKESMNDNGQGAIASLYSAIAIQAGCLAQSLGQADEASAKSSSVEEQ